MKSVLLGWMLGLGLMASHLGCCSVRMVGDRCGASACGDIGCSDCGGVSAVGTLRTRIADRIRSTNCGSGCGEIYWDEQINEPPVCDPCGCNGEFDCNASGSCPSALMRLRSLWGYRYSPSTCQECSTCDTGSMHGGSRSCSTCASNTYSDPNMAPMNHTPHTEAASPIHHRTPTPATKPRSLRESNVAPEPIPDSNAKYDPRLDPRDDYREIVQERNIVGSGVKSGSRSTVARPVSANARQTIQGKPRLVTNPR